jgi:hypothetical protein
MLPLAIASDQSQGGKRLVAQQLLREWDAGRGLIKAKAVKG